MLGLIVCVIISLLLINLNILVKMLGINNKYTENGLNNIIDIFVMFETLIHEVGHSFVSMLNGGVSSKMKINKNGSGEVTTKNLTLKGATITLLSGYTFSALFFSLCLVFIKHDLHFIVLGTLILTIFISVLLIIRNIQGFIFAVISIFVLFISLAFVNTVFIKFLITFIVVISITANIKSLIILKKVSQTDGMYSGDSSVLENLYKLNDDEIELLGISKFYNKNVNYFTNLIIKLCIINYLIGFVALIVL